MTSRPDSPSCRARTGLILALALPFLHAGALRAQADPGEAGAADPDQEAVALAADAFLDPTAEALFRSAQAGWLGIDSTVVRYTAVIKQRIAAGIRTPLKDRTLYRNESAVRAFWDRDHDALVQVLGARAQHPGRDEEKEAGNLSWLDELTIDQPFEPGGDRLFFGLSDETQDEITDPGNESDFWIFHPLARGADTLYRYQSGDTLTLSLPDGRRLRTIQMDVLPREADVHRLAGTLWIEPEEGSLVRAIFQLARELDVIRDIPEVRQEAEAGEFDMVPGVLKPWIFRMNLVALEYSLWEFRVWLPRSMRMEGEVEVGIMKMPISFDVSYDIEQVTTQDDLAEAPPAGAEERHFESREEAMAFLATLLTDEDGVRYKPAADVTRTSGGRTSRFLIPEDESILEESRHLPPPIWEDAPGFSSEEELAEMFQALADLPPVPMQGVPWDFNLGWARHDLLRYNRVEGPAMGGRFNATFGSFLGPVDLRASGFFGFGDLEPKARIELERSSVMRRVALGAFRELRPTDPQGRYLDLGNSLNAFLFGRDDGEYYMATGADLVWRSPEAARETFRFRAYAERQDPVYRMTKFAVVRAFDDGWEFRPNMEARKLEEMGGELHLKPWWGTDPAAPQVGLELYGQAATWRTPDSTATQSYGRASAVLRIALPVADPSWRVGLEAGAGTSWGDVPTQRHWYLGGPTTLRGYEASVTSGSSFARGRLEVAKVHSQAITLSAFGDVAWAGVREEFDSDDLLYGVGVGASLLDGLIRMDLSQGLTGPSRFRVDLYLDAIL